MIYIRDILTPSSFRPSIHIGRNLLTLYSKASQNDDDDALVNRHSGSFSSVITPSHLDKMADGEYSYARFCQYMKPMEHEVEFHIPDVSRYGPGDKVRSDPVTVGNFRYKLLVFPFGTPPAPNTPRGNEAVAAFVEADPLPTLDPERWCFMGVKYSITLVNQLDYRESIYKSDVWNFSKKEIDRGWHTFSSSKELLDSSKGWINNDRDKSCVFRAQILCRQCESLATGPNEYDSKRETGYIGLKNHGATCYLNCLLQTLFHIGKFRSLVYDADPHEMVPTGDSSKKSSTSNTGKQPNLLKALQNMFYKYTYRPSD